MQIALTFRNSLRNVKRRVLHTPGSRMCYITRLALTNGNRGRNGGGKYGASNDLDMALWENYAFAFGFRQRKKCYFCNRARYQLCARCVPVISISIGFTPTTPNSFYITTWFFNTNLTNLSNIAERLVEKTIRFVLHTNLSELYECNEGPRTRSAFE